MLTASPLDPIQLPHITSKSILRKTHYPHLVHFCLHLRFFPMQSLYRSFHHQCGTRVKLCKYIIISTCQYVLKYDLQDWQVPFAPGTQVLLSPLSVNVSLTWFQYQICMVKSNFVLWDMGGYLWLYSLISMEIREAARQFTQ